MEGKKVTVRKMASRDVGVSAEAFAAAQFARFGFAVSVQYGANQPEYDLAVGKDSCLLRISVKGSNDGGWGLTQTFMAARKPEDEKGNYHKAIDLWESKHRSQTVFCLVQFWGRSDEDLPYMYLTPVKEVAEALRKCRGGRGSSMLNHDWEYKAGVCKGLRDQIPESWRFNQERVQELLADSRLTWEVKEHNG